ncbi:MAG: PRC-barrel domain-containing protein [Christensenellales bacterium]|jgi:YlmC/YmxH family sporulation protein
MSSFLSLQGKQVINAADGECLGYICDLELDLRNGQVVSLVIPGPARLMGLIRGERDYVIPWTQVRKIGKDVIIVETVDGFLRRLD